MWLTHLNQFQALRVQIQQNIFTKGNRKMALFDFEGSNSAHKTSQRHHIMAKVRCQDSQHDDIQHNN
jgi:hypothetical protein